MSPLVFPAGSPPASTVTSRLPDPPAFTSPVIVVAAEHDPLFPPRRVLPAARSLFPNLVSATVLTDYDASFPAADMASTYRVNPDVTQGATTLVDDVTYVIGASNAQSVMLVP